MCECQGNPFACVTLALGLPYLLVNRTLGSFVKSGKNRATEDYMSMRESVHEYTLLEFLDPTNVNKQWWI